jgi:hypothetical protein
MMLSPATARADPTPEKAAAVIGLLLENFNRSTHHLHHLPKI